MAEPAWASPSTPESPDPNALLSQGKRDFFCGEYAAAVNSLEEACRALAIKYGETGEECGDAYLYYGKSLLELARTETGVLGNALDGESSEDDDDDDEEEEAAKDENNENEVSQEPDTTEGTIENNEKTEENESKKDDEDVSNLQVAWEVLELAKIIFGRHDAGDMQLKKAEVYLKLGEVGLESGSYDQSAEDFKECLEIQKKYLKTDDRLLAETYYNLGMAYSLNNYHDFAIDNFKQAMKVIESRIEILAKLIADFDSGKSKDLAFNDPLIGSHKELEELRALIPDIVSKIEDTEDLKKTAEEKIKLALAEASKNSSRLFIQEGAGTSTSSSTEAKPISNITHLVRKKRKPDEAAEEIEVKKARADLNIHKTVEENKVEKFLHLGDISQSNRSFNEEEPMEQDPSEPIDIIDKAVEDKSEFIEKRQSVSVPLALAKRIEQGNSCKLGETSKLESQNPNEKLNTEITNSQKIDVCPYIQPKVIGKNGRDQVVDFNSGKSFNKKDSEVGDKVDFKVENINIKNNRTEIANLESESQILKQNIEMDVLHIGIETKLDKNNIFHPESESVEAIQKSNTCEFSGRIINSPEKKILEVNLPKISNEKNSETISHLENTVPISMEKYTEKCNVSTNEQEQTEILKKSESEFLKQDDKSLVNLALKSLNETKCTKFKELNETVGKSESLESLDAEIKSVQIKMVESAEIAKPIAKLLENVESVSMVELGAKLIEIDQPKMESIEMTSHNLESKETIKQKSESNESTTEVIEMSAQMTEKNEESLEISSQEVIPVEMAAKLNAQTVEPKQKILQKAHFLDLNAQEPEGIVMAERKTQSVEMIAHEPKAAEITVQEAEVKIYAQVAEKEMTSQEGKCVEMVTQEVESIQKVETIQMITQELDTIQRTAQNMEIAEKTVQEAEVTEMIVQNAEATTINAKKSESIGIMLQKVEAAEMTTHKAEVVAMTAQITEAVLMEKSNANVHEIEMNREIVNRNNLKAESKVTYCAIKDIPAMDTKAPVAYCTISKALDHISMLVDNDKNEVPAATDEVKSCPKVINEDSVPTSTNQSSLTEHKKTTTRDEAIDDSIITEALDDGIIIKAMKEGTVEAMDVDTTTASMDNSATTDVMIDRKTDPMGAGTTIEPMDDNTTEVMDGTQTTSTMTKAMNQGTSCTETISQDIPTIELMSQDIPTTEAMSQGSPTIEAPDDSIKIKASDETNKLESMDKNKMEVSNVANTAEGAAIDEPMEMETVHVPTEETKVVVNVKKIELEDFTNKNESLSTDVAKIEKLATNVNTETKERHKLIDHTSEVYETITKPLEKDEPKIHSVTKSEVIENKQTVIKSGEKIEETQIFKKAEPMIDVKMEEQIITKQILLESNHIERNEAKIQTKETEQTKDEFVNRTETVSQDFDIDELKGDVEVDEPKDEKHSECLNINTGQSQSEFSEIFISKEDDTKMVESKCNDVEMCDVNTDAKVKEVTSKDVQMTELEGKDIELKEPSSEDINLKKKIDLELKTVVLSELNLEISNMNEENTSEREKNISTEHGINDIQTVDLNSQIVDKNIIGLKVEHENKSTITKDKQNSQLPTQNREFKDISSKELHVIPETVQQKVPEEEKEIANGNIELNNSLSIDGQNKDNTSNVPNGKAISYIGNKEAEVLEAKQIEIVTKTVEDVAKEIVVDEIGLLD